MYSCTGMDTSWICPVSCWDCKCFQGRGCTFYDWATHTKSTQLLTTVGLPYLSTYKSRVFENFCSLLFVCILLLVNTAWFKRKTNFLETQLNWSWVFIKCLHPPWWKMEACLVTELWNLPSSWGDKAHICQQVREYNWTVFAFSILRVKKNDKITENIYNYYSWVWYTQTMKFT